jgi:signal transduction histidine kinase
VDDNSGTTLAATSSSRAWLINFARSKSRWLATISSRHRLQCRAARPRRLGGFVASTLDIGNADSGLRRSARPAARRAAEMKLSYVPQRTDVQRSPDYCPLIVQPRCASGRNTMNTARNAAVAPGCGATELATYLQQMRDEERADLARELHDELGSLLTGAKLEVATMKMHVGDGSMDMLHRLQHIGEIIDSGIAFSRRVVEGLHPSSLTNLGLAASLEILAGEFRQRTGIAMATDLEEVHLAEASQLAAYRVAQESLNNTSKYAGATQARIVMLNCDGGAMMTVCDNGRGFDTAAAGTSSHGLAGMHHRVGACGGQLTVTSQRGRGTLLVAVLPRQAAGAVPRAVPVSMLGPLQRLASSRVQASPAETAQGSRQSAAACPRDSVCRWRTNGPKAPHGRR